MRHTLNLRIAISAILLLTMTGCRSSPTATPTTLPNPVAPPTMAPEFPAANDFAVEGLDGATVHLSDYAGKVIVLNFWAIWCVPCRMEMPELEAVYRQYQDQGVVVLAVNVSEAASDITRYASSAGLTFPIVRDSRLAAARAYRISSLPTTIFLDRQGQIYRWSEPDGRQLDRGVGARDRSFFSQHIEALLK